MHSVKYRFEMFEKCFPKTSKWKWSYMAFNEQRISSATDVHQWRRSASKFLYSIAKYGVERSQCLRFFIRYFAHPSLLFRSILLAFVSSFVNSFATFRNVFQSSLVHLFNLHFWWFLFMCNSFRTKNMSIMLHYMRGSTLSIRLDFFFLCPPICMRSFLLVNPCAP